MGNITGAMVFQACIPTTVGLVFASDAWRVVPGSGASMVAFGSAAFAFISTAVIFLPLARQGRLRGRGLLAGGVFYLAFLVLAVAVGAGLA
jgi:cation:H+ antiporter